MNLRRRLVAYLVALHVLLFAFTLVLMRSNVPLFLAVEVMLLLSLAGGFSLIRRAMRPLEYTERFRDLLQDQDYSARMTDSKLAQTVSDKPGSRSAIWSTVKRYESLIG